ncbi:hypothetical protein RUM44_013255 [Polyplax serrata]|uniref:Anaphase-promoting complex subunit 7 n=1 Tax=Polyplax serrata TaxID=468196 RepID=A0ABR1BIB3_POLSC
MLSSFALSIVDHTSEATSPEKFQTYVYYGNSLFHLGQYRRAEAMYNKALQFRKGYFKYVGSNKTSNLKEYMPDMDIKYQIHLCHINLKQNQEAVTVLETIPGKQRSPKVNMALGKLYHLGGMERSSVYAFKEVLKECPLALEAIEGLLNLRLSGAEVQSFVLECATQKGISNIDWVMSWIKAHDQINSREYGHAISTLKQMDKQSCIKNNHNLLIMLGETYFNAGDSKSALSVLQRAHLIEPQLEKGLDMLASLLAKEKRVTELEKLVPTYIPLREYGPETWIAMAYYLYVNKKTSKAAYLAQKACLLNPRNVEGLLLKAAIFLDLKKYQDSVIHYREAMHLSPYRYEAYEGLVNCYIAMHRLREALTVASGVCKQLGQNPRTLTLYASVLMKDSVSVCKAKGLLEKALQQDDKFLPAVYLLVIILDQELNLEQGISILEKQIQIQPNCKLHHMLGDLYSKNHQLEKATEQYMIALQMDPSNRRLQEAMGKLNQNCNKIDTSYYVAVNDDDNINTTYELGDSENENEGEESEVDAVWSDIDIGLNSL